MTSTNQTLVSHRGSDVALTKAKFGPLELEVVENPSDRLLAVFLLDRSTSMRGEPINEVNRCFRRLVDELREDAFTSLTVDLAVIAFSDTAELVLPPVPVRELEAAQFSPLFADGNTALGASLDLAASTVLERLKFYRRVGLGAYRPCIFVLSDGCATDQWQASASSFRALAESHRWPVFCIGAGNCDMEMLRRVAPAHLPPQRLQDSSKLKDLFSWVKDSLASYSKSQGGPVTMPPVHPWASP